MTDSPSRPANDLPSHADPVRFDALVESLSPAAIVAIIARSMGPRLRAACEPEDIWQETLAAAWRDRAQHTWTSRDAYRAWVLEIARNRIRDASRRLSAEKRGAGHAADRIEDLRASDSGSLADVLPADSVTPSRIASHHERARLILRALDALPEDVEAVVRLHVLEERPMESVAAELDIHLSAAWRRFRRGAVLYRDALRGLDAAGDVSAAADP
ncbi:MAG: RNA polymerase sigma factor [Planctomycetes bacterium]|nr:RNA polymerase sigma factor [Planctomycetota bacterium]